MNWNAHPQIAIRDAYTSKLMEKLLKQAVQLFPQLQPLIIEIPTCIV